MVDADAGSRARGPGESGPDPMGPLGVETVMLTAQEKLKPLLALLYHEDQAQRDTLTIEESHRLRMMDLDCCGHVDAWEPARWQGDQLTAIYNRVMGLG